MGFLPDGGGLRGRPVRFNGGIDEGYRLDRPSRRRGIEQIRVEILGTWEKLRLSCSWVSLWGHHPAGFLDSVARTREFEMGYLFFDCGNDEMSNRERQNFEEERRENVGI